MTIFLHSISERPVPEVCPNLFTEWQTREEYLIHFVGFDLIAIGNKLQYHALLCVVMKKSLTSNEA
jgi:hypothetical protein